jgi:hypothetical protein
MKRFLSLLTLPALLAGCTAHADVTASPPAASTTTTANAGAGAGTGPEPGTTTKSTVPIGTAASSRCHTADLSVKIGSGEGAAGTTFENLVFTNKSGHRCTLYGYPGVSWVTGDSGKQVNDPFVRDGGTVKTIALAPGGAAHAVLATHDVGFFSAAQCKPVPVRGFRVYPPDETAAVFVSASRTVCSAKGVNVGRVRPIASGSADA